MPDREFRIRRSRPGPGGPHPVMLAVAGDSAAGKTSLVHGLVRALGADRCTRVCVDDYHRYDRAERTGLPFTVLDPRANHIDIMEQHLQMLATGQAVLKPVYDHRTGTLGRPEYVEPRPFILVEGLLPLVSRLARACFDLAVFLEPPEALRRAWKLQRDVGQRGYTRAEVLAELDRREADAERFVRAQRRHADIVVRFSPPDAELLLRGTVPQPPLHDVLTDDARTALSLTVRRDEEGTPVDCLQIHGHAAAEEIRVLQKAIWSGADHRRPMPAGLGALEAGRSEPLAVTQLLLLRHLLQDVYQH